MTAGRERSAGQAALSVAARDRVSLRVAGGRPDGSDERSPASYPDVDGQWTAEPLDPLEAAIVFAMRRAASKRRQEA